RRHAGCYLLARSTCHRAWMDSICSKGIRVVNIDPCAVSEFTLEKLLVKNKVEQWRVVVDLEDCSITSTPIGILKQVCDTLTDDFLASVNQNQIEERYGGTCSNVKDFSWPVMPPGPFGC
ncbi:hypothetical protein EMWEY_00007840, partial [Eimeria maxima]